MKKIVILVAFATVISLFYVSSVFAQNEEPTPTPETDITEGIKDKINDLKERLATRVAELRENSKRAFYGVIKEIDDNSMILLYRDTEITVGYDDETTYATISMANKKTSAKRDDFELGETAVVFGTLDLDEKTIIASHLYQQDLSLVNYGTVSEVDENDGSFTIDSNSGSITLDYEISSKCTMFKDDEATRCGLTQIEPGDKVFLRIKPDDTDISRATIERVLLYKSPTIVSPTENPES